MQKWLTPGTKLPPTERQIRADWLSGRKARENYEALTYTLERYFPPGKAKPYSYFEKQASGYYFREASDKVGGFFGNPLHEPLVVKERRGKFSRIGHLSAFAFDDGKMAYIHISGEAPAPALAHELVHSQDAFLIGEMLSCSGKKPPRERVTLVYMEGRASFVEGKISGINLLKDMRQSQALIMGTASFFAGAAAAAYPGFIGWSLAAISLLAGAAYCRRLSKYIPFNMALMEIEREIGSAAAAFRITSQKLPLKMSDIRRPLEFYKEEIAAAKAGKNEEAAS